MPVERTELEKLKDDAEWMPEQCISCGHRTYTTIYSDVRMFRCAWREWPPKHWLHLQEGGSCPRKAKLTGMSDAMQASRALIDKTSRD